MARALKAAFIGREDEGEGIVTLTYIKTHFFSVLFFPFFYSRKDRKRECVVETLKKITDERRRKEKNPK